MPTMLGIKAKFASGKYHLTGGSWSSGGNTSSRIIRRCIRGGGALLRHANRRLYSSKNSSTPPDPFGGQDLPLHRECCRVSASQRAHIHRSTT